jgi:hypothetical protein
MKQEAPRRFSLQSGRKKRDAPQSDLRRTVVGDRSTGIQLRVADGMDLQVDLRKEVTMSFVWVDIYANEREFLTVKLLRGEQELPDLFTRVLRFALRPVWPKGPWMIVGGGKVLHRGQVRGLRAEEFVLNGEEEFLIHCMKVEPSMFSGFTEPKNAVQVFRIPPYGDARLIAFFREDDPGLKARLDEVFSEIKCEEAYGLVQRWLRLAE